MAGNRIASAATDPGADNATLAAYLADLAARLHGPRRRRDVILAELRDGLDQAIEDHVAAGLPPEQATTAAITGFGTPQAVAHAFAAELATAYARRAIAWYLTSGPVVGIWWLLLLYPSPWRSGPIALVAAIPVIPLVLIAIAAGGATLATTGRLMRWLPEASPHGALAAVKVIAAVAIIGDLTMITLFVASGLPIRQLAATALIAGLTRIACSITTLRRATRLAGDAADVLSQGDTVTS